jgi:dual-specificity kinase
MSTSHPLSGQTSKKRQRSREPDWNSFYKNGLPKEVIVIDDDSPPPRVEDSFESPAGTVAAGGARQAAKKRKRDDVGSTFDPTYGNGHISNGNTPYKASGSGSSASTDRTTSAIHTTAATSLGSQYSHNGATNPYEEDLQPGTKRKRVATRQQIANEAKRREIETIGDAFTNYKPPPRPPLKAAEVLVRQAADVSIYPSLIFSRVLTLPCRTLTPKI